MIAVHWEEIQQNHYNNGMLYRASVPGGWLIKLTNGLTIAATYISDQYDDVETITFVPDPDHLWGEQ